MRCRVSAPRSKTRWRQVSSSTGAVRALTFMLAVSEKPKLRTRSMASKAACSAPGALRIQSCTPRPSKLMTKMGLWPIARSCSKSCGLSREPLV